MSAGLYFVLKYFSFSLQYASHQRHAFITIQLIRYLRWRYNRVRLVVYFLVMYPGCYTRM